MDNGLLPRRYAKALYKFAAEKNDTAKVYELMENVEAAFSTQRQLESVLANPFVALNDKIALVSSAAGEESPVLDDFVKLLARNNRMDILRAVAIAYTDIYRAENNIHLVDITSAAPLRDDDRKRLTDMIEKHIGDAKAQFSYNVNPDLIGGFVVKIDNESLDASVRNELKQLRTALMAN